MTKKDYGTLQKAHRHTIRHFIFLPTMFNKQEILGIKEGSSQVRLISLR